MLAYKWSQPLYFPDEGDFRKMKLPAHRAGQREHFQTPSTSSLCSRVKFFTHLHIPNYLSRLMVLNFTSQSSLFVHKFWNFLFPTFHSLATFLPPLIKCTSNRDHLNQSTQFTRDETLSLKAREAKLPVQGCTAKSSTVNRLDSLTPTPMLFPPHQAATFQV